MAVALHATAMPNFWRNSKHYYPDQKSPATNSLNRMELICPTFDAYWSKKKFGKNVSDFVFREPHDKYTLVEIEAPHRLIFRKDGHPRQMLTHAIAQIRDWVRFIQDNRA